MSQRQHEKSGRGAGIRQSSGSAGSRGIRGRSRMGARAQLPLSSQGRVQTSNPAVIDWLVQSSASSSQVSVGSSDTTLTWHGPVATRPPPPPSFSSSISQVLDPPPARQLLASMTSQLLFDDDEDIQEVIEERQDLQGRPVSERSASRAHDSTSNISATAGVSRPKSHLKQTDYGDSSSVDKDDAASDITWDPGQEVVYSTVSDSSTGSPDRRGKSRKQLGSSGSRLTRKRSRDRQMTPQDPSSHAGDRPLSLPQASQAVPKFYTSPVWEFFDRCPDDVYVVICRLCSRKVKRGKSGNPGTTGMAMHMKRHHLLAWEKRGETAPQPVQKASASASSSSQPLSVSQTSSVAGSVASLPSSAGQFSPSSSRQPLIGEALSRRQQYAPSHPTAVKLTGHLAKLLVLQTLPFHVVDSAPFRDLMSCAEARWKVPSRHYFSRKAVPAMHNYVREKLAQSLSHSVSDSVHLTTDVWSCNYGQGQYMSVTAHWLNVVWQTEHQQLGQGNLITPPRCHSKVTVPTSASSSSSASSSAKSTPSSAASRPPGYHLAKARQCHAVLHLACLGERSHTGEELLRVLQQEIQSWLTPRRLKVGIVVSDNGSNILSALRRGGLRHAPCMAHVFNLIVTRFIRSTPHLQTLLKMSRKLCNHFSHSYRAQHTLLDLQRKNGLPHHRLICDVATRWNSTLHMLDRLYEQRKALTDFLLMQADTATPLCNLDLGQWQLMRDTCRLLRPFEEATFLVSAQETCISAIIPLLHVLELMLLRLSGQGDEVLSLSQPETLEECLAAEEEEDWVEEVEEEEEEEEDINAQELVVDMGVDEPSRDTIGGPELVYEDDEEDAGTNQWQYAMETEAGTPSLSLVEMAKRMLICFRADPRINNIRRHDDFWVATLLDPRYRNKLGEFFPSDQREEKLTHYTDVLSRQLVAAYAARRSHLRHSHQGHTSTPASSSSSSRYLGGMSSGTNLSLKSMMNAFLQPQGMETGTQRQQQDMVGNLQQQVQGFLDCSLASLVQEPQDYWVGKLDLWPQLAEFALSKLSCPASSVSSERVFSAAGHIVGPRRTRLSSGNVERLTFIKMNCNWIDKDFVTPAPDTTD